MGSVIAAVSLPRILVLLEAESSPSDVCAPRAGSGSANPSQSRPLPSRPVPVPVPVPVHEKSASANSSQVISQHQSLAVDARPAFVHSSSLVGRDFSGPCAADSGVNPLHLQKLFCRLGLCRHASPFILHTPPLPLHPSSATMAPPTESLNLDVAAISGICGYVVQSSHR